MRRVALWIPAGVVLVMAVTAAAYVPPAYWLLNRFYDQRNPEWNAFQVELQTHLLGPEWEGGEQTVEERWSFGLPMKFRGERELPLGTRVRVVSRGTELRQEPGAPLFEGPALFDPVVNVFGRATVRGEKKTYKGGDLLVSDLQTAGVDTKVTGLTRDGEWLAVIVGAKESQPDRTQFWIDKTRWVPLRFRLVTGEGAERHVREVRYLDYPPTGKYTWFPRRIETWLDGRQVQISELTSIAGSTKLDRARFDLKALRRAAAEPTPAAPPTDAPAPTD